MEQFEKMLTCPICHDRYKNPKLLPCQHSFCIEPCLDRLVDYVRRRVKCPECRAEHEIPYQGVRAFPNNVTLHRFLELHNGIKGQSLDPTDDQIMEACEVCMEKDFCVLCVHCDKKCCTGCKDAHTEKLTQEILSRTNAQVFQKQSLQATGKTREDDQLNHNRKQIQASFPERENASSTRKTSARTSNVSFTTSSILGKDTVASTTLYQSKFPGDSTAPLIPQVPQTMSKLRQQPELSRPRPTAPPYPETEVGTTSHPPDPVYWFHDTPPPYQVDDPHPEGRSKKQKKGNIKKMAGRVAISVLDNLFG